MARRTKADAAKTREQILEAALKIFSAKGYSKATFVDVAREIGLSKGAVYWHFKTKPDLLAAVIAYGDAKYCASANTTQVDTVAELRRQVEAFATVYTTVLEAWSFEFFCNFQIEWSSELLAEVHEKLKEMRGDPMKKFEEQLVHLQENGALSRARDAEDLARYFGSSWVGSLHLAMCGAFNKEQFIEVLMTSFDLLIGSQAVK
ncbi:TetR family transcriptional regulator [Pontiellaceae bacterium B12219]|nr:TetR family transcriptional regulator [Pontiellaceae bacterium B12219]